MIDEKEGKAQSQGILAATIMGEARVEYDQKVFNPKDWDDLRDGTMVFIRKASIRHSLEQIQRLDDFGLEPNDCQPFLKKFRKLYRIESYLRGLEGPTGLSNAGWLRGKKEEKGLAIWRVADGFLNYKFRGGKDAIWFGPREIGKSDGCLHYQNIPWMEDKKPVVSRVDIDNKKDWPLYNYKVTDADMLIGACDILIKALDEQEDVKKEYVKYPNIMLVRDDIAGSGISRKRAAGSKLFNLECLGMIARHFGLATVWVFQYFEDIPSTIRRFTTHWFKKTDLKMMESTIKWGRNVEHTKLYGLDGLADRKADNKPYLDYDTRRPQITGDELPMMALMQYINYQERQMGNKVKDLDDGEAIYTKKMLFKDARKFLIRLQELERTDKGITREDLLITLGWIYIEAKKNKGFDKLNLTHGAMASLVYDFKISKDQLRSQIYKIEADMEKNPGRWIPTIKNRKEQLEYVKNMD